MANWRAGELDKRISLKRYVYVPDGLGGQTKDLVLLKNTLAKVLSVRGRVRFYADKVDAVGDYLFVIRNRISGVDLTEDDVIEWDGYQYNIEFIAKEGSRNGFLAIEATRGVAI